MHDAVVQAMHAPRPAALPRLRAALVTRCLAMSALAAIAGVLYLVNLTVSGYANTYYALAAQAGSQSWSALFFGALDVEGFITLDKPPLATWLMAISVKAFGLSSWSILLPQALLGIATVLVLYLAVRRSFGPIAALVAGVVMATTPVAVLIFRYNNPDALLTFLLVAAAWAMGRGLEAGRLRWALLAAGLVGAAFLTKYLQAYLVLPVFALAWLACAPVSLRQRIGGLLASATTVLVASGWWVAIVELLPASARPYIGGSTNNSVLDLILGYDGLGRIFGNTTGEGLGSSVDGATDSGAAVAGAGGFGFGGDAGLLRMFNDQFGGQIGWLIPGALMALAIAIALYRRGPRTDRRVAGYVLWGGWLLVHVAVFSFMSGIIHPYYTVAIAPAVAALVGAGAVELWARREEDPLARFVLAAAVVVTGGLAWLLLARTPDFAPGLGFAVIGLALAAGLLLAVPPNMRVGRAPLASLGATLALVAILSGPIAYAAQTMATAQSGGDPAAGPQVAGAFNPGGEIPGGNPGGAPDGTRPDGEFPDGSRPGGAGGGEMTPDSRLIDYLLANRSDARWIVAVSGSSSAAAIQLAAGEPVMAMGGFSGSDPAPTTEQLQAYVAAGELRYVLLGGGLPGGPGGGARGFGGASAVTSWVASACEAVTVADGMTTGLYDCAGAR